MLNEHKLVRKSVDAVYEIVISVYVGKYNYLLSWTADTWLRQPEIGIRHNLRASNFYKLLGGMLSK